jgi:hypothetical protein
MVICIVALAVFSILGIFSATYRKLAKEAFSCVGRMLIFRPCKTNLEQRIKSKIAIKLMKIPPLARFFYKYFKVLSWIFTISFFVSMAYSAYGIYNLIVYGSCQPGSVCVITQGVSQFTKITRILNCYEAYVAYGIIVVVLIALLAIKYFNIEFKIER